MHLPNFSSWRTSTAGVGALVFAACDLVVMFHNGDWDATRLGTSIMAILTGLGFLTARDRAASEAAHVVQAVNLAAVADVANAAIETAIVTETKVT